MAESRTAAPAITPAAAEASTRRPDIQGLRAIAVLMVVAFHAGLPVAGGFVGVDVFFVISGFVITAMLQREWAATGRIRFAAFYWRRFKRLTPAVAVMVGTVCILGSLLLSPFGVQQETAKTALGVLALSANYVIAKTTGGYFDAPAATNPLLNTWSLSVEEQFYLLFPAVIAFGWWLARRTRRFQIAPVVLIAGIGTLSFTLTLLGTSGIPFFTRANLFGFYSPISRAWEFAAGALLALAVQRRTRIAGRRMSVAAGTGGAVLVALAAGLINDNTTFPGLWTLLPVTGALLLIAVGTVPSAWTTRLLAASPMVKIGDWSYSIYLWHWPCIVIASALLPGHGIVPIIAATASFAPALASYRWIEQPIRALTNTSPLRAARLATTIVLPPMLLAAGLGYAAHSGWWSSDVAAAQSAIADNHMGMLRGCHNRVPISERVAADCTWNAKAPGEPIYLVGDSNADHFSDGLVAASTALHRPLVIASIDTCPFADVWTRGLGTQESFLAPCRSWITATMDWLDRQPSGTVIISNSDGPITLAAHLMGSGPQTLSADPQIKARALQGGLDTVVQRLHAAGHRVLLVMPVPHYNLTPFVSFPSSCTVVKIWGNSCQATEPESFARAQQAPFDQVLQGVAASRGTGLLDLYPYFCRNGTCRTKIEGVIAYRNATHITVAESRRLAPVFEKAIRAAG